MVHTLAKCTYDFILYFFYNENNKKIPYFNKIVEIFSTALTAQSAHKQQTYVQDLFEFL